ncbi:MAG: hypothetical protein R3D05_23155, partial [Dongiaceae bacterium]
MQLRLSQEQTRHGTCRRAAHQLTIFGNRHRFPSITNQPFVTVAYYPAAMNGCRVIATAPVTVAPNETPIREGLMKLYMHPVSMTSRPVRLFIAEN